MVGYASLLYYSVYPYFKNTHIPEIHDVWIADTERKKGLGTQLVTSLETLAKEEGFTRVGIGVGLYADYGPAQKLYYTLGYVPDGNGVTYKCQSVIPGNPYPVDDDLVLWLIKPLI